MRKMKTIFSRVLSMTRCQLLAKLQMLSVIFFLCVSGVRATDHPEQLLREFVQSSSWQEASQSLRQAIVLLQGLQKPEISQQVLYASIIIELERYQTAIKAMMINPKTKTCYCAASHEKQRLGAQGYTYVLAWAKKTEQQVFIDFYVWYWHVYAYLFCAMVHDAQVAPDDSNRLLQQARCYLRKLEASLFHLGRTCYYEHYAQLLEGYKKTVAHVTVLHKIGAV